VTPGDDTDAEIARLREQLAKLAERVKHLETWSMRYVGVWLPGRWYSMGETVTFGGGLWHCHTPTSLRPGEGPDTGWTLAVKKGARGRSAYDSAKALGFSGSEREWLASLHRDPVEERFTGRPEMSSPTHRSSAGI
jgi:hypothetical protein